MSGIAGSKLNIKGSGRIAKLGTDGQALTSAGAGMAAAFEDLAGGVSWQTIETGSTMTAVAGNGYWVDTTSNACTITLPASASVGDTIIFTDYARNWGTNGITIDSNGLNYQSDDDTFTVEYGTDGMTLAITYMDATQGWVPTIDEAVTDAPSKGNQEGIFGFGYISTWAGMTNLVSNAGVVASDVSAVGTARVGLAATQYGGDKGIFAYGTTGGNYVDITNLVTSSGVVGSDGASAGTARGENLGACSFGVDEGIFGFGNDDTGYIGYTNLVSSSGVVASDVSAVGTARNALAACEYGGDKGIFGFGYLAPGNDPRATAVTNLVSNTGVVASDTTGVGTGRNYLAACSFGYDKGIFAFNGYTNLVSNAGVVATDVTQVGTARARLEATQYGGDKGIFGFGYASATNLSMTNLVTNAGVIGTDVTGVGTARREMGACSFN